MTHPSVDLLSETPACAEIPQTNQLFGCSFEGIDAAGRNDPPVAVVIAHHGVLPNGTQSSGDNNNNQLFGTSFEAVKRAVVNNNSYTHFFGQTITNIPNNINPGPATNMG